MEGVGHGAIGSVGREVGMGMSVEGIGRVGTVRGRGTESMAFCVARTTFKA